MGRRRGLPGLPVENGVQGGKAVKLDKDHFFSPIGKGEYVHIFHKQSDVLGALCYKGPGYTMWQEAPDDEICRNCLREYRKREEGKG